MKNKFILMCSLIICVSLLMGCTSTKNQNRQEVENGEKSITVIEDIKDAVYEDIAIEKIDVCEGIKGFDWITEDKIIMGKENRDLYAKAEGHVSSMLRNLYQYNLSTKKEQNIDDKLKGQEYIAISPDKKYVLYHESLGKTAYISSINGDVKAKFPYTYELDEAVWVSNDQILIPMKGSDFYFINIDGTKSKIENIEKQLIRHAVKIDNKIYYITYDNKMKIYDINKREKTLFEDNVVNFILSPDKKQLIISKHLTDEEKETLVLTDLEGKNKETLIEGRFIYGEQWSPDGTKLAYMLNKGTNEDVGFYIINMKNKIQSFISKEYFGYGEAIWSPSSKKIMINMEQEEEDGRIIDATHIITLK